MLTVTNHTDGRSSSSDADFGTVLNLYAPCGWVFAPWTDDTTPRTTTPVRFGVHLSDLSTFTYRLSL